MPRAVANLLATLSTGYILFFYSERLFWTVRWPGTTWLDLTVTWLAYSAVAYLFLAVVSWSQADDLPSVFLAGAIFGWLIEGGVANTLYGTQSSAPLPWSISLTALSWHALISVVVGWWATKRALVANSVWPLAVLSAAIGVFWGAWAMFPRQESPPILVPLERFSVEAFAFTLILAASWWIEDRVTSGFDFRPGWVGAIISALAVALFYAQHVLALGARALIMLPALVGAALTVLALRRWRRGQGSYVAKRVAAERQERRLLVLLVMPTVGTVVFGIAAAAGGDRLPIAATVYAVTGVAGFALLIISTAIVVRRHLM